MERDSMRTEAEAEAAQAKPAVKDLEGWLPITKSRRATWWHSAFHNVTAMVGAGILGLPYSLSELGWGWGVSLMLLSWTLTLYTMWQMVEMHEMFPEKRMDRYHELGQAAFGEKAGLWVVVPLQLIVEVGLDIVFMITGGKSLKKIYDIAHPSGHMNLSYFTIIFGSVQFFTSHFPDFTSLTSVSIAAAVMSCSYSIISWASCLHKGILPDVSYAPRATTSPDRVFSFLSGLGQVAFSFAGHNVILEIQAAIPSTPENPSKKPMWKGCVIAYIVVAFCYFPVAFLGYAVFGNTVEDNVLMSLEKPSFMIIAANAFVVVHLIGSYQVFALPVFDMIESYLVKKKNFKPTLRLRIITRTLYVAFTMIVAITFPFFGDLMGFLGGIVFAPTSFYLPCIIWLKLKKPKRFGFSWFINWACIVIGVIITIVAPIGALRQIIVTTAKHYKFFS